ncbi:MAG: Zn-dependent hydrolase [Acidobacteria bacterium]|nr:Zn-dependent hydrolase [Acidobacteriota bacterium]
MVPRLFLLLMASTLFGADAYVERQLAKWKPVRMPYDSSKLSERERRMVNELAEASRAMEQIYWRQSDPAALELYRTTPDALLKRFLFLNGSRYDLIAENRPFAGAGPVPPGRNLYPAGLTRAQVEQYVREHPEQKAAIYSSYTVVKRKGATLEAVPYSTEYRPLLEHGAAALRKAAALSDDAAFAKFLTLRAEAFLKNDYYPSDLQWMDLTSPKFDVIMGPYETYLDDLLGVKTSFSAAILIRNEAESAKLTLYQKFVPGIQDALPLPPQDRPSKKGHTTPMEVMDAPFRTGDLLHGYQAVADNLPNDPRIHAAKGTKKIFFKNFMDARVNEVVLPLARFMMREDQAAKVTGEGYMAATVMHEICHGLGPAYARVNGKQVDIREAIGGIYSALEEAKADVTGMFGLKWLVNRGALDKSRLEEYYASYVGGIFRSVRYGIAEPHGRAEMMEFNFLASQGAIRREGARWAVDYARITPALTLLAKELLEIEATGDRGRAERWFAQYDKMPADLGKALAAVTTLPVDIEPRFDFSVFPK